MLQSSKRGAEEEAAHSGDEDDALLLALVVVHSAHAHRAQPPLSQQQPDLLHLIRRTTLVLVTGLIAKHLSAAGQQDTPQELRMVTEEGAHEPELFLHLHTL